MKPYTDLLRNVLLRGERVQNRTGIDTISLPGQSMQFDLRDGFPLLSLRKVPFKSVIAELIGFLQGATNASQFRELGTRIWDANANENKAWLANPFRMGTDELGPVYGYQWRQWEGHAYAFTAAQREYLKDAGWVEQDGTHGQYRKQIDQLQACYDQIMRNQSSRRILFHAWNPAELHAMALPPCHLLYQFHCHNYEQRRSDALSLTVYIRSNDLGLGTPFNIASAAALLHLMAAMTGRNVRYLTIQIGDAHVYVNHVDAVQQMLGREDAGTPAMPYLQVDAGEMWPAHVDDVIASLKVEDFHLTCYHPLPAIKMEMAV